MYMYVIVVIIIMKRDIAVILFCVVVKSHGQREISFTFIINNSRVLAMRIGLWSGKSRVCRSLVGTVTVLPQLLVDSEYHAHVPSLPIFRFLVCPFPFSNIYPMVLDISKGRKKG